MINAGDLTKQITIQVNNPTKQPNGSKEDNWSDWKTNVWTKVITQGGKEFYAAQKINSETTAVFQVRYFSGLTVLHRIKYGSRIFNILPPINNVDERNEEYLVSGKEVV